MSGSEDLIAEARSLAATRAGLPPEWGARLSGSTIAEIEADATAFRESLDALRGPATPPARTLDGGAQGRDRELAQSGGANQTLEYWKNLARTNPDAWNAAFAAGEVTMHG